MRQRFVAASALGALVIALGALGLAMFGPPLSQIWLVTFIWCFVPLAWGIWAMLAPQAWVPLHLPYWGAILGLLAGMAAFLVLNIPYRAFAWTLSLTSRAMGMLIAAVVYYFLWMLVRSTYVSLASTDKPEPPSVATIRKAA